jgi:hypothetical protein
MAHMPIASCPALHSHKAGTHHGPHTSVTAAMVSGSNVPKSSALTRSTATALGVIVGMRIRWSASRKAKHSHLITWRRSSVFKRICSGRGRGQGRSVGEGAYVYGGGEKQAQECSRFHVMREQECAYVHAPHTHAHGHTERTMSSMARKEVTTSVERGAGLFGMVGSERMTHTITTISSRMWSQALVRSCSSLSLLHA